MGKSVQTQFSNPSPTSDLHNWANGVIHVMNAVTAAKKGHIQS